jgi:hypothetical protein
MTSIPPLQIGSLVIAKHTTAVCAPGERGVCYETYTLGDRPGGSILFERGGYDGFSPPDVAALLEITGQVCPEVADYEFKNVGRLADDFRRGRFAPAWANCTACLDERPSSDEIAVELGYENSDHLALGDDYWKW